MCAHVCSRQTATKFIVINHLMGTVLLAITRFCIITSFKCVCVCVGLSVGLSVHACLQECGLKYQTDGPEIKKRMLGEDRVKLCGERRRSSLPKGRVCGQLIATPCSRSFSGGDLEWTW